MRKLTPFVVLGFIILVLASCGKEKSVDTLGGTSGTGGGGSNNGGSGGSSNGSELGTWKLLNMRGITSQTVEYQLGDAIKAVTTSDYTTDNNTGTLKFDGSTMTGTGIGYSVDDIANVYIYTNGTLEDSMDLPFSGVIPATNTTATYKKIGADSIYVQSGVFSTVGTSGTSQSAAGGYKLAWNGDKMTMRSVFTQSKVEVNMGISQKTTTRAEQILTLQKQ